MRSYRSATTVHRSALGTSAALQQQGGSLIHTCELNASGAFTAVPGSPNPVVIQPESVAVGYFNGTGKVGLAVANKGSDTVTVLATSISGPTAVSAASGMLQ